jgi:two-component system NtrC family sensor kinase
MELARAWPWAVAYAVSGGVGVTLTVLIYSRGRGPLRRRLALVLANVTAVLFANTALFAAPDATYATYAARASQAVVAWLPLFGVAFAAALGRGRLRALVWTTRILAPVLSVLSLATPYVIVRTRPFAFGFAAVPGPLYPLLFVEVLLLNTMPIVAFAAWRHEQRPLERRQLGHLVVACLIAMIGFVDTLPLVGIDAPPIGWLPLDGAAVGLLIAIVRHRFLDIRMATRRALWWLVSTVGTAVLFAALALPLLAVGGEHPFTLGLVAAALLLGMRLWLATAQASLDRLVGRRRRDLDAEMAQLTDALAALQTSEALGRAIDRFLGALDRRLAALVVIEPTGKPRVALSAWGAVPAPSRQSPLLPELRSLRAPVSRDQARGAGLVECERACVRWGAEYLAPLIDGEELLGIIAVAPKAGGGRADALELEAIDRMCVTATAALASARLYERLHALHRELEEKAEARQISLAKALRDLRGAEQRLVQSEKLAALGQIVGGVAADLVDEVHTVARRVAEVRGHVAAVAGAVDCRLRAEPTLADEAVREMVRDVGPLLDAVGEGARRALAIAQDLSGFAPSAPEAPATARAPARLEELCDGTLKLCAGHLAHVQIVRDYDRELPPVPVEAGPLGQVVLNLILNASQAMRGSGTITISTRRCELEGRADGGAELAVSDTGPGIAPDVLPRIFEPFFSTKGQAVGTGLGLSVSFGIVERHGGRIHVESTLGVGTTFRVQLPLV